MFVLCFSCCRRVNSLRFLFVELPSAGNLSDSVAVQVGVPSPVLSRLHRNGVFLLENSVRSSTRQTYGVGVRAWFRFCQLIVADPF